MRRSAIHIALVLALAACTACAGSNKPTRSSTKMHKVDNTPAGRVLRNAMRADMQGRYADAERLYREALSMRPGHVETASNLALFLVNRDRLDEALVVANNVVRASKGEPRAYHLLAELLLRAREYARADAALSKLIERDDELASAYALRARAREAQKMHSLAIADLRSAVRYDSDNADYLGRLGALLVQRGKLAEAEPFLIRALRVNKRNALALLSLGTVLRDYHKQPRRALPIHLRAYRLLGESHWQARYQLGITQAANGLHLGAEKNLAWAVRQQPKNGHAWLQYARVVQFREKWVDAEQAWRKVKELGLWKPSMEFQLGVARFGVGKLDSAEKLLNNVLARNPDNPHAYLYLGLIHKRRGLKQLAIDALEKYLELAPKDDLLRNKVQQALTTLKAAK